MEAANLGGYLANMEDSVLEDVLEILRDGDADPATEYKHTAPADRVLEKYGFPKDIPR